MAHDFLELPRYNAELAPAHPAASFSRIRCPRWGIRLSVDVPDGQHYQHLKATSPLATRSLYMR
jgi:hypothetical protein